MSIVLRARSLVLGYRKRVVLDGADLEVRRGELWFIIGPNGCGKTTFLRAVLGTLRPLRGELHLDPELASRSRLGFVPQQVELNPAVPTTLGEFVSLGLVGLRVRRAERRERLRYALEAVGLAAEEGEDLWSLSGGQRQRALVARALVRRPSFLVLDEPTSGLDLPSREALLRTLRDVHEREGLTTLFVTHDLELAARHGNRFALVHDGRFAAGTAEEVFTAEHLERTFGIPLEVERTAHGFHAFVPRAEIHGERP